MNLLIEKKASEPKKLEVFLKGFDKISQVLNKPSPENLFFGLDNSKMVIERYPGGKSRSFLLVRFNLTINFDFPAGRLAGWLAGCSWDAF